MQEGFTVNHTYSLDLDTLVEGQRIGLLRTEEGALHFHLDGRDKGVAFTNIPDGEMITKYSEEDHICVKL